MSWEDYRARVVAQIEYAREAIQDIEENGFRIFQRQLGQPETEQTGWMLERYKHNLELYSDILKRIDDLQNGGPD